jgi:hypothetical protein
VNPTTNLNVFVLRHSSYLKLCRPGVLYDTVILLANVEHQNNLMFILHKSLKEKKARKNRKTHILHYCD